jgi:hypothetical protein
MTAELASLGTHCAFCGSLDFLPIPCTACDQRFCRVHAPVDAHACASTPSLVVLPSAPAADPVAELRAAHTPAVVSRGASGEKDAKREAALAVLAVLARNFPAKPASAGTAKAPMRKPLSRKLVIMKLRQRATSADPRKSAGDVPVAERLHLEVKCEGREAALWIAKVRKALSPGVSPHRHAGRYRWSRAGPLCRRSRHQKRQQHGRRCAGALLALAVHL